MLKSSDAICRLSFLAIYITDVVFCHPPSDFCLLPFTYGSAISLMLSFDFSQKQTTQQSSLNTMLVKNQVLHGRKSVYRLVEQIKTKESVQSTLWKAEIIHSANYIRPANLPANL